jgi:hypothetical protein
MGRSQRRFVGERDETRAGAHHQTDLLESLRGEKGCSRPVGTLVHAETGERKYRDQGDEADGQHAERGENLHERQSLLIRKERPHAY